MNINYLLVEKIPYLKIECRYWSDPRFKVLQYRGKNPFLIFLRRFLKMIRICSQLFNGKFVLSDIVFSCDYLCNYRCSGCGQHMPQIRDMPDETKKVDLQEMFKSMDRILEAVDGIGRISFACGEGFLNRNLLEAINYFGRHPKILDRNAPTNGTIIPSDNILSAMKENDVSTSITKYPVTPQEKIDTLVAKLEEYGIRYGIDNNRTWYDTSEFRPVSGSPRDYKLKYRKCDRHKILLNNNELWNCNPYGTAVFCGKIQKRQEDFIHVNEGSVDDLRKALLKMAEQDYSYSCTQCSGYYGKHKKIIPAGVQIQK